MTVKSYIMKKVSNHYDAVIEYIGSKDAVLGVFAYGSMNYGLFQYPESDVDTKAIVIPTLDNCIFDQPISKELHIDDEHCEVKDIRLMVDMYKKQNINFVETLFTPYFKVNPKYEDLWRHYFIENREAIAHYDERKCVMSIVGQALHSLAQIKGWDGKKYANTMRLIDFLESYLDFVPYEDCLVPVQLNRIREVKYSTKQCLTNDEIDQLRVTLEKYKTMSLDKGRYFMADVMRQGTKDLILRRNF